MEKKTITKTEKQLRIENEELRSRLTEAEEALNAIRNGEVDAIIVTGPQGEKVFSLASAETPYRIIVEEMNEGAVSLAVDGTILYCNRRFAELVSCPLEKIVGSNFARFVAESEKPKFDLLMQAGLKGRSSGEIRYYILDGNPKHFHLSFNALPLNMLGDICIMTTDITDLKQKEEELRRAQDILEQRVTERTETLNQTIEELTASRIATINMMEAAVEAKKALEVANKQLVGEITERKRAEEKVKMFSKAVENSYDGLVLTDLMGNISCASESVVKILGYSPEEVMKLNLAHFCENPEDAAKIIKESETKGGWNGELIAIRKNKAKFSGLLSVSLLKDDKGNPTGMLGVLRDITERQRLELALGERE